MRKRGYCAIGVYKPKNTTNMGTIWRSAQLFGADYIFTIGHRYKKQPTDTLNSTKHIPLFNYDTWEDFIKHQPEKSKIVLVEQSDKQQLDTFKHPERAVYVLGAEDEGIPQELWKGNQVVNIPSLEEQSLNVAVAASLVLYERFTNT